MSDDIVLKGCPFCGNIESLRLLLNSEGVSRVQCQACKAEGPYVYIQRENMDTAKRQWNNRTSSHPFVICQKCSAKVFGRLDG